VNAFRIFVVGCEPAIGCTIVNYLSGANLEAHWVPDAHGLLDRIARSKPDLVVLDRNLSGADGLVLLQRVRQNSTVPVILVSDIDEDELDRVVALELGADDYVTKPLRLAELHARIRAKLRRRTVDSDVRRRRCYTFEGWVLVLHAGIGCCRPKVRTST
jgi:DNA-binding response OmpR family regulator